MSKCLMFFHGLGVNYLVLTVQKGIVSTNEVGNGIVLSLKFG